MWLWLCTHLVFGFSPIFLSHTLAGSFVLLAYIICPHIFIGFLTPVDKRHPLLSAAATQPLVGLILEPKTFSECVSPLSL